MTGFILTVLSDQESRRWLLATKFQPCPRGATPRPHLGQGRQPQNQFNSIHICKGTEELEAYIDSRYEAGTLQAELDALETAFAERVSEDEPNMTEEEPNMAEAHDMGVDLEEWLAIEYFQYLHPKEKTSCLPPKTFTNTRGTFLKDTAS